MPLRPIDTQIIMTQVNRVSQTSSHNNAALMNAAAQGAIETKKNDRKTTTTVNQTNESQHKKTQNKNEGRSKGNLGYFKYSKKGKKEAEEFEGEHLDLRL
jgi:hypothetical protein